MKSDADRQDAPVVLYNFGSPITIVIGVAIFVPLAFNLGRHSHDIWLTFGAALTGSLSGVAYWLYKPLNLFSDNSYAPKTFRFLTAGERKALAWLHTREARKIPVGVAIGTALISSLGTLFENFWIHSGQPPTTQSHLDKLAIVAVFSACMSGAGYHVFISYALLRRWDWIQKHQPEPGPGTLDRYRKGAGLFRLEKVDYIGESNEMDEALARRPGKGYWRVFLQFLGGALAGISGFTILTGRVAESRFWPAVVIGGAGLILLWISGRVLGRSEPKKRSWDDLLRK